MRIDKDIAKTILKFQASAPVNVVGLVKFLGLEVWESHDLPEGIAGKIFRDKKHGGSLQYSIVVRAEDSRLRKRFTVAHELAHYILHRHLFTESLIDDALYRSNLSTRIEAQANGLAADLLMPWHLLSRMSERSIAGLAELFEVSEQAMRIRLNQTQREIPIER